MSAAALCWGETRWRSPQETPSAASQVSVASKTMTIHSHTHLLPRTIVLTLKSCFFFSRKVAMLTVGQTYFWLIGLSTRQVAGRITERKVGRCGAGCQRLGNLHVWLLSNIQDPGCTSREHGLAGLVQWLLARPRISEDPGCHHEVRVF